MPEFDGQLQRSASNATLVSLDFSDGSQIRGLGIFESINGSTQPTRNSLPTANRADGYIAVVKSVNKVYLFDGNPSTSDWTNSANWTELGGPGNEVNNLNDGVTWVDVPDNFITEGSVTQHEAALTIGQGQVTGLGGALTTLQNATTANGSAITTLQGADTTLQNNINAVNTTISGLDTDDITEGSNLYYTSTRFDTAFGNKTTDDLTQGSTNLYNVQADWSSTAGLSQILNKPPHFTPSPHAHAISDITNLQSSLNAKVDDGQVLTNVPANAVFTDTTYSVQDGELSQNNFTDALKANIASNLSAINAISEFPDDLQSFNEVTGTTLGEATDGDYYFLVDKQVTGSEEYNKLDSNGLLQIFTQQVADYLIDNGFLSSDEISFEGLVADINGDGVVGTADLLLLLTQYGSTIQDLRSDFTYSSAPFVALQTPTYTQNDWVTIPLAGTATRVIPAGESFSTAWNIDKDLPGDYIELEDYTLVNAQSVTTVFTSLYGGWRQVSGSKSFEFEDCDIQMVFNASDVVNLRIKIEFYDGSTLRSTEHYIINDFHSQQVGSGTVTKSLNEDISTFVTNKWPSQNASIDIIRVRLQAQSEEGNLGSIEVNDGGKFIISVGQE